jgi:hypothetical protein
MDKAKFEEAIGRGLGIQGLCEFFNLSRVKITYWLKKFELKTHFTKVIKKYQCICGESNSDKFYYNASICSKCWSRETHERGKKNRAYSLAKLGNKCFNCGFDKWSAALDIHHIDPLKKDITFNRYKYWGRERLDRELKKCILLCANCHRAHHSEELLNFKLNNSSYSSYRYDDIYNDINFNWDFNFLYKYKQTNCLCCNKIKFNDLKFCSLICARKSRPTNRPSKEILEKLLWEKPTTHIAKDYNVSDKAVEKWAFYYKIKKPGKGYWQKKESILI